jgi:hypothetical protein
MPSEKASSVPAGGLFLSDRCQSPTAIYCLSRSFDAIVDIAYPPPRRSRSHVASSCIPYRHGRYDWPLRADIVPVRRKAQAQMGYPLVCRSGGGMQLSWSALASARTHFIAYYSRAPNAAGNSSILGSPTFMKTYSAAVLTFGAPMLAKHSWCYSRSYSTTKARRSLRAPWCKSGQVGLNANRRRYWPPMSPAIRV